MRWGLLERLGLCLCMCEMGSVREVGSVSVHV